MAEADQQGRAQAPMMRQHKPHGPHNVRRHAEENLTLLEGTAQETKFMLLQIAQPTVPTRRRSPKRPARQAAPISAPGRIAGEAAAIAAADNRDVPHAAARVQWRICSCQAACIPAARARFIQPSLGAETRIMALIRNIKPHRRFRWQRRCRGIARTDAQGGAHRLQNSQAGRRDRCAPAPCARISCGRRPTETCGRNS
jgi:hypothetical protein